MDEGLLGSYTNHLVSASAEAVDMDDERRERKDELLERVNQVSELFGILSRIKALG